LNRGSAVRRRRRKWGQGLNQASVNRRKVYDVAETGAAIILSHPEGAVTCPHQSIRTDIRVGCVDRIDLEIAAVELNLEDPDTIQKISGIGAIEVSVGTDGRDSSVGSRLINHRKDQRSRLHLSS